MAQATNQTKSDEKPVDVMPDIDDDAEVGTTDAEIAVADADAGDEPPRKQTKADRLAEATRLYREKRDAEEGKFREEHGGDAPAEDVAAADAPAVAEAQPEAEKPAAQPAALDDDAEIELVVFGTPIKKKLKDIKADAQKLLAADQKFDEATRLLKEAKALKNTPAQRDLDDPEHQPDDVEDRATRGRTDRKSQPEHQPADELDATALDSIVERIQVGDKDEGRAAIADLVKLVTNGNTSRMDETKVREIVRADLHQVDTEKEIQVAIDKFAKQFPTIASDDEFSGVALQRVKKEMIADLKSTGISDETLSQIKNDKDLAVLHGRVRQSGAKVRTYDALLTDVGTHFSNKFGTLAKSPAPNPTPAPKPTQPPVRNAAQERVEMKRAAAPQPRAAGARAPAATAPKPKTHQEIIAEMRRARRFQ